MTLRRRGRSCKVGTKGIPGEERRTQTIYYPRRKTITAVVGTLRQLRGVVVDERPLNTASADRRTSLIVDPPEDRIPLTTKGRELTGLASSR